MLIDCVYELRRSTLPHFLDAWCAVHLERLLLIKTDRVAGKLLRRQMSEWHIIGESPHDSIVLALGKVLRSIHSTLAVAPRRYSLQVLSVRVKDLGSLQRQLRLAILGLND